MANINNICILLKAHIPHECYCRSWAETSFGDIGKDLIVLNGLQLFNHRWDPTLPINAKKEKQKHSRSWSKWALYGVWNWYINTFLNFHNSYPTKPDSRDRWAKTIKPSYNSKHKNRSWVLAVLNMKMWHHKVLTLNVWFI